MKDIVALVFMLIVSLIIVFTFQPSWEMAFILGIPIGFMGYLIRTAID